jgi:Holliday junction resolvase RusA-like endonuclease
MKPFPFKQSPSFYQEQINCATNSNRVTVSSSDVEQGARNASLGAQKVTGLAAPCRIHIRSIRQRLADADGISAKAVIDGLRHCGILADDSPEYVQEVSYSQEKGMPEKTIITITEV